MRSLLQALQEGRLVELPETDKDKSLQYLAHLIEAIPEVAAEPLKEEVLQREKSGNTGIGLGVACPHVRSSGDGELLCAVGWSPSGIEYGSKDGGKVHLVVMYYIPDSQKITYLREVSSLAGAIKRVGGIQAIAKAADIPTVREELLNWVSAATDAGMPESKARMIRLEAKQAALAQAEETVSPAESARLQVMPLLILTIAPDRYVVLCENREVAAELEKDPQLGNLVKQQTAFDRMGFHFVHRATTLYDPARPLYEYLAAKMNNPPTA